MNQISVDEALATQTLPFKKTRGRGWGVQCKIIKKNGQRCQRYAIHGGYVCHGNHGGNLPTVRRAAEARLQQVADSAVLVLKDLIENGESEAIRLRAAKYALKFAGVDPGRTRSNRSKGQVAIEAAKPDKKDFKAEIIELLGEMGEIGP